MKLGLSIFLFLSGSVLAQTTAVTKNPNTNQITGNLTMGANRLLQFDANSLLTLNGLMRTGGSGDGGKIQVNNSGITFGSVDGMLTIQGRNNHAIVARTPSPTDGIALVGWSSSGASGVKAVQDTHFTSPTITAWRDLSKGGWEEALDSPGLLVAASGLTSAYTTGSTAIEVTNHGTTTFQIQWDGKAFSNGAQLTRWRGVQTAAPTTDLQNGDMYFLSTTSKIYIYANGAWRLLN
jgi:hypothetical protein